jgi:TrmH family RNA methyltransferase
VIGLRKLAALPAATRRRKTVLLLQAAELELEAGRTPEAGYLRGLAELLLEEESAKRAEAPQGALAAKRAEQGAVGQAARRLLEALPVACPGPRQASPGDLRRVINSLRHALLACLGAEPAEWDFLDPGGGPGTLSREARRVFPIAVYLEQVRSPFNVGAIFRAAEAFAVSRLLLCPETASPRHPRAEKTARGAISVLPWQVASLEDLRDEPGVFALELGGTPLPEFRFPERGTMLVGSEELGLSPEALEIARAGRVSVPMAGAKRSLNVAVAFGIVMQAWFQALCR